MVTVYDIFKWVPRITGAFSFFGSLAIVYIILANHQRKLKHPKDRIMLMMSVFDVMASAVFVFSTTAMTSDSGDNEAMGNSWTCTAEGVCAWLGFAVPLYNSSLNLFYLLVIKYSMTPQRFAAKIEPLLHLVSIAIPLSAAIIFAARGEITSWGNVCFTGTLASAIIVASIVSFSLLFCIYSMSSICWSVKRQAARVERYMYRRPSSTNISTPLGENETVKQALLYTSAFILTFIGPLSQALYFIVTGAGMKYLKIFTGIFYPLQGFWNFALYVRPGVNHIRQRDPDKSLIGAIREVVFKARPIANRQHNVSNVDVTNGDAAYIMPGNDENLAQVPFAITESSDSNEILANSAPKMRRKSLVHIASILEQMSLDDLDLSNDEDGDDDNDDEIP